MLKPTYFFVFKLRRISILIRVIVIDVATELFEKQDFIITCPFNKGNPVKYFNLPVIHLIFEVPFNHSLIFFVKELLYIPLKNSAAGIPFVKPKFDFCRAVIFRPPTFDIDGIICKKYKR